MILIIVGILIVFWAISVYNKLIALRNRVKDQWVNLYVEPLVAFNVMIVFLSTEAEAKLV